jgi:hypothetical protein
VLAFAFDVYRPELNDPNPPMISLMGDFRSMIVSERLSVRPAQEST